MKQGIIDGYKYDIQRAAFGTGFIGYVYSPKLERKSIIKIYADGFISCEHPHAVPLKIRVAIKKVCGVIKNT